MQINKNKTHIRHKTHIQSINSAFSFNIAHDFHNNLKFGIFYHFHGIFMKFTDIVHIFLNLLICFVQISNILMNLCQCIKQNVSKSPNALHMKYLKNTRSTTNTRNNSQNKKERQMKDNMRYKSWQKRKSCEVWKSRWIPHFSQKMFRNIIVYWSCFWWVLLFLENHCYASEFPFI